MVCGWCGLRPLIGLLANVVVDGGGVRQKGDLMSRNDKRD